MPHRSPQLCGKKHSEQQKNPECSFSGRGVRTHDLRLPRRDYYRSTTTRSMYYIAFFHIFILLFRALEQVLLSISSKHSFPLEILLVFYFSFSLFPCSFPLFVFFPLPFLGFRFIFLSCVSCSWFSFSLVFQPLSFSFVSFSLFHLLSFCVCLLPPPATSPPHPTRLPYTSPPHAGGRTG